MKKCEIRIGNVTNKGIIESFYESGVHVGLGKCFRFSEIRGQSISIEWLEKLGFEKVTADFDGDIWEYHFLKMPYIGGLFSHIKEDGTMQVRDEMDEGLKLYYVHEIQNIFFELNRKELKIKNNVLLSLGKE
jgi:hypothetical protein